MIWGERDAFGTVDTGRRITELIPEGRFATLPGGHAPWFHHAEQIATITQKFLAAQPEPT